MIGVGTSAALVAMALATLLAAPLVALGGYVLAGWMSVAVCAVQFLVARSLPFTPAVISVAELDAAELEPADECSAALLETGSAPHNEAGSGVERAEAAGFLGRYGLTLRVGTGEVLHSWVVRGGVLASAMLMGLLAFDEYFGLMLGEQGARRSPSHCCSWWSRPVRLSAGWSLIGWLGGAMRGSAGSPPAPAYAWLWAR